MRVLFLTAHLPYGRWSGGRLREEELLRRVADHAAVDVCAISKAYDDDRLHVAAASEFCAGVSVFRAADGAVPPLPLQVARHRSSAASAHVAATLEAGRVDVVHLEGFYLLQHLPRPLPVPVVIVAQNIEYLLWAQRASAAQRDIERRRHEREALATRVMEVAAWRAVDACAVLTDDDAAEIARVAPEVRVLMVPDGADHLPPPRPHSPAMPERPTLVYVGNFAYAPNVDAALHLTADILPRIRAVEPRARLLLVGNAPPREVRALADGEHVVVTGRVPSVEPYLDLAHVVVCPLRIGGGVKVKVLEALARGKAVVTTRIGAQGLSGLSRSAIVTDGDGPFARAVLRLLHRDDERRRLERAAFAYAASLPTWDAAAAALLDLWRSASSGGCGSRPAAAALGEAISIRTP